VHLEIPKVDELPNQSQFSARTGAIDYLLLLLELRFSLGFTFVYSFNSDYALRREPRIDFTENERHTEPMCERILEGFN
jgi:hypothetical protein